MSSSSLADAKDRLRLDNAAGSSSSGTRTDAGDDSLRDYFGNACLDLFLLQADETPQCLRDLLADAWDQDTLTALKLVCHRRTVKRDREGFFAAATWMLQTHPRVFVDNLSAFADLGYVQDLVALLDRLSSSLEAAPEEEEEASLQPAPAGLKRARDDDDDPAAHHVPATATTASPCSSVPPVPKRARHDDPGASASARAGATATAPPSPALMTGPEATATTQNLDHPYHTLHRAIADFFVDRLRSDLGHLNNGNASMISLAARWCLDMGSPSDQTTLLRMHIARRLFTDTDTDTTDNMLLHLRRNVLDRLVSALDRQKQQAPERRQARRIKLPHLIARNFGKENWEVKSSKEKEEITNEWYTMVGVLRAKGYLRNCIAVCDMSKGGLNQPQGQGDKSKLLKVCVALGLLVAELSEEPWKDCVHAFSSGDGNHSLANQTSYPGKVEAIRGLKCDGRFNLRRVLEWVLDTATRNKVEPRDMVRTIFVFTGKDFEQAIVPPAYPNVRAEDMPPEYFSPDDVRRWRDDYRIVCEKFKEHDRYDDCVPGIVVWNLRGERSAALTSSSEHDGVLSLSGYSDDLLRLFLDKGGVVHADDEMNDAIAGEQYQKLEVKEY